MTRTIDLNSDCGESYGTWRFGNDEGLMPHISSANLACGFHAGDAVTMLETVRLAKQHGVAVGAHPGFPDLAGFGRRAMNISPDEAYAYVTYQIGGLRAFLDTEDVALHHVKLHGALAVVAASAEPLAAAIVDAVARSAPGAVVYSPYWPGNVFHDRLRDRGITVIEEMYADMRYDRRGIVIQERVRQAMPVEETVAQVESLLTEGQVRSADGEMVPIDAGSICFHGDGRNALELIEAVRQTIDRLGGSVAAPDASTARAAAA
jgi:UPF0271 protein